MRRLIAVTAVVLLSAALFGGAPARSAYLVKELLGFLAKANTWTQLQSFSLNPAATGDPRALTTAPASFIGADGAAVPVPLYAYGSSPSFQALRTGGTFASPSAVAVGNTLGSFVTLGWNGSAFSPSSGFLCTAAEAFTTSAEGVYCRVQVTQKGGTTSMTPISFADAQTVLGAPIGFTTSLGVQAAGTTLATATALTSEINEVTGGTGGVSLRAYQGTLAGGSSGTARVDIINVSGATINVYPPVATAGIWNLNGSASALSNGTATTLANGAHGTFECTSSTRCYQSP